ncbi:MAG: DUF401 family protein [Candidatus Altiarchaeota archaeon]
MIDLAGIFLVLAVAVYLIQKKVRVEHTLFLCSVLTGFLFGLDFSVMVDTIFGAVTDVETIELAAIVILITFLGAIMKHLESLSNIVDALNELTGDVRATLIGIPAFIGLLPMPAGAMVSAPYVEDVGGKAGLSPEQKTVVNYWFRHIWEYSFPLYPAIVLAAAILEVPYQVITFHQTPLTAAAIFFGLLFITRKIKAGNLTLNKKRSRLDNVGVIARDVWPVALVITAALAFKLNLVAALTGTILLLSTSRRINPRMLVETFREVNFVNLALLIMAVMAFKDVVAATGAAQKLAEALAAIAVPNVVIIFLVPFIIGLLTGVSFGVVGISFPIILPFLGNPAPDLNLVLLAYAAGMMGLLLSPVHLCLVVTREYFKADIRKTYFMLAPLIISMTIVAALLAAL